MSLQIEYTDTFGGEANYSWCHRWHSRDVMSAWAEIRLAKSLCGLTGVRCRKVNLGETIALYPAGMCRVVFISYAEPKYEDGKRVDRQGNAVDVNDDEEEGQPMTYTYAIECLPEDIPVEGNASAIDPETDTEIAAEIRRQLESGNDWAWCTVCVTCTHTPSGITGTDYLGCCNYKSKEDFCAPDGYFADMKDRAREECEREMARMRVALEVKS